MKVSLNTNKYNPQIKPSFKGIYNNKHVLKSLKFAAENSALFSATVGAALSVVARPIAILSTPKTDERNKKFACAKSLSSSVTGYLIMAAASMPVANAVKKIDDNPQKFLKTSTIKNLQNGAESLVKSKSYMHASQLFKLGLGLVIAAPKSILTCFLIPPVMKLFFPEKKQEVKRPVRKNASVISFKGAYSKATTQIAKGIGKIINVPIVQKFSKKVADTNFSQHIMSLTDVVLTWTFVNQTKKNKKIEESRKKPLIHNSLISTGMCVLGGYAINAVLKKPTERFVEKFKAVNKDLPELEKYVHGIDVAKPALILGGIYYIIIPIISTFLADRTSVEKK